MKFNFIWMVLIVVFASCDQKSKSKSSVEEQEEDKSLEWIVTEAQKKKEEIDNIATEALKSVKSLRWEKTTDDFSSFVEVTAFLDEKGALNKVKEFFYDGTERKQGEYIFYLERDEVFATVEQVDAWMDSNYVVLNEKETYYKDGEPFQARLRSAQSIDEIASEEWEKVRPERLSIERAMRVLESKGEFKTHFLSYIQGAESLFLLLGEPKEANRFTTALRVDEMTPFIFELLENAEENRFKEVEVTFSVVGGGSEPEFRVLNSIDWKEK
jgi:hypothetical protein